MTSLVVLPSEEHLLSDSNFRPGFKLSPSFHFYIILLESEEGKAERQKGRWKLLQEKPGGKNPSEAHILHLTSCKIFKTSDGSKLLAPATCQHLHSW